jgi:Excalibur calcium-binding domain
MKKILALLLVSTFSFVYLSPANSAAKKFKNCTELNKVYPGGVAKPGAVNKGGAVKKKPFIDAALYKANIKSDRDKDGIACEK